MKEPRRRAALGVAAISSVLLNGWLCPSPMDAVAQHGRPRAASPEPAEYALAYASDYFSFVGTDERGRVAFALDNNRGRDGDEWQAEHFVVLHEEGEGWIEVEGNGVYDNAKQELIAIPDSEFFQFRGTALTGLTIMSQPNHLTLRIDPVPVRVARTEDEARFWMGSAPAVMEWGDRTVKGRVIYEYLFMPNFNRLTRTYFGLWKEFHGFYVSVEHTGDLYLHSQQSDRLAPLIGKLIGFAVFNGREDRMDNVRLSVLDRSFALGFYRWPSEWQIEWMGKEGPGSVRFTLSDRKVLANWIIGGFAMGIVQGDIAYGGRTWPFYGLAELLM